MGSQAERYKSGVMPYAQMTSSSATQRFNDELDAELIGLKPVKSRIRDILYRPENERDYGQEAIEILLQVMETHATTWWLYSRAMSIAWTLSFVRILDYRHESRIIWISRTTPPRNWRRLRSVC
jgi:hypothetical protein